MRPSPAERAHDRILTDVAPSLRGVTHKALLEIARRHGTENVPQLKAALVKLRLRELERG